MSLENGQGVAGLTHQREWYPLPNCRRKSEEGYEHCGTGCTARKTEGTGGIITVVSTFETLQTTGKTNMQLTKCRTYMMRKLGGIWPTKSLGVF